VNGKVFVFLGKDQGDDVGLSVKLPHSRDEALAIPGAEPTGYGLGKSGWVSLRFQPGDDFPLERVQAYIAESWQAVAPKRMVKAWLATRS
jgi:predicted DNA-binding protein (MmcQ/YjbR family)